MQTEILEINEDSLAQASKLISCGDIVAFPTETVYGLGANAFNESAVKKIYEAKGRPSDNPLIVHVSDKKIIETIAKFISDDAKKVIDFFMPGPITVVLQKKSLVPDIVTGNLDTVAVRMPSSAEAQKFLAAVKYPICAPSANTSSRPSPTSWKHVLEDMNGRIPLILKGEDSLVGIESTVVDFSREVPLLLRPGIISKSQIEQVLGKSISVPDKFDKTMNSPGIRYKHYAPKCDTFLNEDGDKEKIESFIAKLQSEGKHVALVAPDSFCELSKNFFSLGCSVSNGAHNIFSNLRDAEKTADAIVIVWNDKSESAVGVFNRVSKSCGGKII